MHKMWMIRLGQRLSRLMSWTNDVLDEYSPSWLTSYRRVRAVMVGFWAGVMIYGCGAVLWITAWPDHGLSFPGKVCLSVVLLHGMALMLIGWWLNLRRILRS